MCAGGSRAPVPELLPPVTREDGSPVTLLSVADGECRFPCGEGIGGALVLCGRPVKAGAVYCDGHRRIAFVRPQKAG